MENSPSVTQSRNRDVLHHSWDAIVWFVGADMKEMKPDTNKEKGNKDTERELKTAGFFFLRRQRRSTQLSKEAEHSGNSKAR